MAVLVCQLGLSIILNACALSRPCSEGGDLTWNGEVKKGDKVCEQAKDTQGNWKNQGKFILRHSGSRASYIEGQYLDGYKDGIWTEYNREGKAVAQKFFVQGVEKPIVVK